MVSNVIPYHYHYRQLPSQQVWTFKTLNVNMPSRMDDVMRLCGNLSANQQIKVAVKNSGKGAAVAGGTAFIGGLLAGPPGLAVGKVYTTVLFLFVCYFQCREMHARGLRKLNIQTDGQLFGSPFAHKVALHRYCSSAYVQGKAETRLWNRNDRLG